MLVVGSPTNIAHVLPKNTDMFHFHGGGIGHVQIFSQTFGNQEVYFKKAPLYYGGLFVLL